MRSCPRLVVGFWVAALAISTGAHAQGRGGGNWTTVGGDAQRTGSVRADPRISRESAQKPGFQLLWQRQLDPKSQTAMLTQPVLMSNIISYKGFKALAFLGGSPDTVYSIDYDLNRMFWERRLNTGSTGTGRTACPTGLTAVTRPTPLPSAAGAGRGRAGGPGGGGGGGGRGGNNNVYAVSSGGMAHALNPQTGEDVNPPARFLTANANLSGLVFIDNMLYAAATGNCGGVSNGVYALDVAENANKVVSWDSKGAAIAGNLGPSFGADGTIYVATGGATPSDSSLANSVVVLEPRMLTQKDMFTATAPFTSSPAVFAYKGRTLVAASNADGSLYVLDAASIGGADHRTPLIKSAPYAKSSTFSPGAVVTWEEPEGVRWLALASGGPATAAAKFQTTNGVMKNGGIVAFRLTEDAGGALGLEPAWTSRDIESPGTPIVLNGVVFVVSNGEHTPAGAARAQRGRRSVLYALDSATGKELWNSGSTMTSFVPGVPPSGGDGQVYVVTADGTLYAFGIPLEH